MSMRSSLGIGKVIMFVAAGLVISTVVFGPRAAHPGQAPEQAGTVAPQSFEVASIKPSAGDGRLIGLRITPGGRYTASGVTTRILIQQAYDIRDYQISGGPGWTSSDRYDIVAKAETPGLDRDRVKVLLQSLLAERFNLRVHRETKELPIYVLLVGKNGHKLRASEVQPAPKSEGPPDAPKPGEAGPPGRGAQIRLGRGELNAQMAPISTLVRMLAQQLGRPVVDKTGIKGNFDFNLEWTPDETQRGIGLGPEMPGPESPAPRDSSGPSIFTALQEQLGLRLESQKGPVEILVIDQIEKPSEN